MFSNSQTASRLLAILPVLLALGCELPDEGAPEGAAEIVAFGTPSGDEPSAEIETSSAELQAAAANSPAITSFSPASGTPGQQIIINGANFNRDRFGALWTGAPPYKVRFKSSASTGQVVHLTTATFTVVSSTQLKVTVPANAVTDKVRLTQTAPNQLEVFHLSPTAFTVNPATIVRFVNNSQYALVSLTSGGVQALPPGAAALSGQQISLQLAAGGTFAFQIGLGSLNGNSPNPFFIFNRNVTATAGTTTTVSVAPLTLGQVMTVGSQGTTTWMSDLFLGNDGQFHLFRLSMLSNGSWKLFADNSNVPSAQGTAAPTFWPNMTNATATGPIINFNLNANLTGGAMAFPYSSFFIKINNQVRLFTRQ